MKKALALATAALLAGSLTACGGSSSPSASGGGNGNGGGSHSPSSPAQSSGDKGGGSLGGGGNYCSTLKDAAAQLKAFNADKLTDSKYSLLQSKVSEIEASAPSSVKGDWDVLSQTLAKYKQLLNSAGLSFDDLTSMQNGQLPSNVNVKQLEKVAKQLEAYAQTHDIQKATNQIEQNAKSLCHVDLNK